MYKYAIAYILTFQIVQDSLTWRMKGAFLKKRCEEGHKLFSLFDTKI